MSGPTWKIVCGDALSALKDMPAESIQCCVTSPPYWGLRDYGTARWEGGDAACSHSVSGQVEDSKAPGAITTGQRPGVDASCCRKCGARRIDSQLGLEPTPELYLKHVVEIFHEVRRVLRNDGVCFLNLGDSYWGGKGRSGSGNPEEQAVRAQEGASLNQAYHQIAGDGLTRPSDGKHPILKPKDLVGIPWRVAFALQADGWYLRSDIIWAKPNPMPESVKDRPTKAHEYLFLLAKSAHYFYDHEAIKEKSVDPESFKGIKKKVTCVAAGSDPEHAGYFRTRAGLLKLNGHVYPTRNLRSVWVISAQPFKGSHFATFPEKLVEPCIKAGTSERGCCSKCGAPWGHTVREIEGQPKLEKRKYKYIQVGIPGESISRGRRPGSMGDGQPRIMATEWCSTCECSESETMPCTVLDPFAGAGTTGLVALRLGRSFIGIELKTDYVKMAQRRITNDAPLFDKENVQAG